MSISPSEASALVAAAKRFGIATADRHGIFQSADETFSRLVGYSYEELAGRPYADLIHPEEVDTAIQQGRDILAGRRSVARFDRRYIHKDGSVVWASVTLTPVHGADGEVDALIAIIEDLTEQRAMSERAELQAQLLGCVEQSALATDLEGRIIYWSRRAEEMHGWKAEELLGRRPLELIAPEDRERGEEAMRTLLEGKSWSGEITLMRRDGSRFPAWIIDAPLFDANGNVIGIAGVSYDITAQKTAEKELRRHKAQLAAAQEIAGAGSWTYDYTTGEAAWSDTLCRIFGFAPGSSPSLRDAFDRIHPADTDRVRAIRALLQHTQAPFSTEFRLLRDGQERTLQARIEHIRDAAGEPAHVVCVVQDITEQKRVELELLRRAQHQTTIASLGQLALSGASLEMLFAEAAKAMCETFDVEICEILQKEDDRFVIAASRGLSGASAKAGGSQASYTIERGAPVIVTDIRNEVRFSPSPLLARAGAISGMTVPIHAADGTAWGVLGVHSLAPRTFQKFEIDAFGAVATVLGQAIDRARADAELRVRERQQTAIAQLGQLTLRDLGDATFERACELLMTGLGCEYAFYADLVENGTKLRYRTGRLWAENLPNELPVDANAQIGYSMLCGEPIVVDDYRTYERARTADLTAPYGILSGATVPVASATRTFGILCAYSRVQRRFGRADVEFIQSLANMLAEAIERDTVREAVFESEARFRRIVDGASEIIFTMDAQGRFIELNRAFEAITGCPREDWLGRSFHPFIESAEENARLDALLATVVRDEAPVEVETTIRAVHGHVELEISMFPKRVEGYVEVYGFARDITAERRAEREREQLTRNLQLLLESTVEGICTLDLDGHCTMVNRAAAELLGRQPEELLGRSMHGIIHSGDDGDGDFCAMLDVVATGQPCYTTTDFFAHRDGTSIPVEYSAAPILDNGVAVGVVVSFVDVTERRKLESKLEQASRLSALGRLAATVAHEFNNVLMGISPFVEVIRRSPPPERVAASAEHIARAVQRGRRITEDILRFTQPAEPVVAQLEAAQWLRSFAVEAQALLGPRYEIVVDAREDDVTIDVDPNQLHQIYSNLILNARDAMPEGGPITIAVRREAASARFDFGAVDRPERYAHLIVADGGSGIPKEMLAQIFEPLFTTKKSGTGLGLPVTHQVVQRHRGEIFVESRVGEGTTFHIFLPLSERPAYATAEAAGDAPLHAPSVQRILLVEDDRIVAAGLCAVLEAEGMEVEVARTGSDALRQVRESRPDALVLDVGLPDMDGSSVFERLSEAAPGLPVIFSTGHAVPSTLEQFLTLPHVAYLMKPYDVSALMQSLAKVLPPG